MTGFIPRSLNCIAKKFRLKIDRVKKVWKRFYTTREFKRPKTVSSGVKHLQPETNRPSMTTGEPLRIVKDYCDLPIGASKVAINRAVRNHTQQGKWCRKRMVRPSVEKFTPENIEHCQEFINYITTVDPYRLKFFDEGGIKLPDIGSPKYGHSLVGTPCVELMQNTQSPEITLNLLCGTNSIMWANTVNGASKTPNFLQFCDDASLCLQPNERPSLKFHDHAQNIEYRELLRDNLHVREHDGFKEITVADLHGFNEYTRDISIF